MKHIRPHCVVITCFDERQPGYLDFLYRIRALAKVYQVTLVSQHTLIQQELLIPRVQYHSIPHQGGKLGWLTYLIKSARYARSLNPDVVMLLHSALAPITMLMGNIPSCLYWNEHPTNLMHMPSGFSPIKKCWHCYSNNWYSPAPNVQVWWCPLVKIMRQICLHVAWMQTK